MKYRSLFAITILIVVSLACASMGGEPTKTPQPPTETPLPTNTATAIPTATPNLTATAVAKAEEAEAKVLAELDDVLGDTEIPYKDGKLAWAQDESLEIRLLGPDSEYLPFAEDVVSKNFILKSEMTWSSTGILICGSIFRSEPDLEQGKQYAFVLLRFSGAPAWEIDFNNFGYFQNSPTKTQFSSALNQENKSTNEFVLVAQDEQFNVYINGVRQGRFFDYSKQSTEGRFGFLAGQDFGEGSCVCKNTWVWELP
jgi:hypothetical protein